MKITRAVLDPFEIPLTSPLDINGHQIKSRQGYYLKLLDIHDTEFIGELSPLPGLHEENLQQAKEQLVKILPKLLERAINLRKLDLTEPFGGLFEADTFPSVQFAIESALLDLIYRSDVSLLDLEDNFSVPVNSLVLPTKNQSKKNSCIKLKIGKLSIEKDIERINSVRGDDVKLRLDGNRSLSKENLCKLLDEVDRSRIEYLEEPLADMKCWKEIYKKYKVPLALDESISTTTKFPTGTTALVVKPAVVGGVSKTMELMQTAQSNDFQLVISSSFESSVGMKANMLLAHMQEGEHHHGLDTLRFLDESSPLVEIQQKNNKLYLS